MTPEQLEALSDLGKRLNGIAVTIGLPWDAEHRQLVFDTVKQAAAEIARFQSALEEAEKRPLTPKVIAELIRGKVARMGRLEETQENTRFYSEGDWSVTPGTIPRPTKPCIVIRLTEDEAAALDAMVKP